CSAIGLPSGHAGSVSNPGSPAQPGSGARTSPGGYLYNLSHLSDDSQVEAIKLFNKGKTASGIDPKLLTRDEGIKLLGLLDKMEIKERSATEGAAQLPPPTSNVSPRARCARS